MKFIPLSLSNFGFINNIRKGCLKYILLPINRKLCSGLLKVGAGGSGFNHTTICGNFCYRVFIAI